MSVIYRYIACFVILLAACSCKGKTETVVATVDNQRITAADLIDKMRMEKSLYDPSLLHDEKNFNEFRRRTLDGLIQETVLLRETNRLGIKAAAEDVPGLPTADPASKEQSEYFSKQGIDPEKWKQAQQRRSAIGKLIENEVLTKVPVSDDELSQYYNKHIDEFRQNTRFHARQILVDKKKTADSIRARLMKGEDFAALATEFSISPDKERGGDLGYFDSNSYPEIFSEICQQLKPGDISEVVATPYGYQIFQLIAKMPSRQRSLEEVKSFIKTKLQEERLDEFYAPWLENLMKNARVSIDDKALKEVALDG